MSERDNRCELELLLESACKIVALFLFAVLLVFIFGPIF